MVILCSTIIEFLLQKSLALVSKNSHTPAWKYAPYSLSGLCSLFGQYSEI